MSRCYLEFSDSIGVSQLDLSMTKLDYFDFPNVAGLVSIWHDAAVS